MQFTIAAAVLAVVLIAVLIVYTRRRNQRTAGLKSRFGSEYDRAVHTHGSVNEAESKLAARETRVEALKIRELGITERERFVTEWSTVQFRFVDHPKAAVIEADDLINALLEARGYPRSTFEQRAADVSVHYPRVMENYRAAHLIAVRPGQVEATTEELRTAIIKYRDIFDDLLRVQKPIETKTAA